MVSGRDEAAVAGATATPRLRALSPGERKPTSLEARTLMGDFFFAVAWLSMSSWIFWASILSSCLASRFLFGCSWMKALRSLSESVFLDLLVSGDRNSLFELVRTAVPRSVATPSFISALDCFPSTMRTLLWWCVGECKKKKKKKGGVVSGQRRADRSTVPRAASHTSTCCGASWCLPVHYCPRRAGAQKAGSKLPGHRNRTWSVFRC